MRIGQHENLPYVVECKSTQAFFEPIAAFNCRQAADGYAGECSTANPSFTYRVSVPVPVIEHADLIERRIMGRLIPALLTVGPISVWDGEEMCLVEETDPEAIYKALASTDRDELYIHRADGKPLWLLLIWGNGRDIINDYNLSLEPVIAPINDWIEETFA